MVKLLGFLTILFLTITVMFFVFLTRFNEESKRTALMSRVAGVMVKRDGGQTWKSAPTITIEPIVTLEPIDEPTATSIPKKILEIKLGEIKIEEKIIEVKGIKEVQGVEEAKGELTKDGKIPWQKFDLNLNFLGNVQPGSSDNKFIFQNKELEIKILNKKDEPLNLFLYKIFENSIIINPESGIWEGDAEFGVEVYSDGVKVGEVKFAIE